MAGVDGSVIEELGGELVVLDVGDSGQAGAKSSAVVGVGG